MVSATPNVQSKLAWRDWDGGLARGDRGGGLARGAGLDGGLARGDGGGGLGHRRL